MGKNNKKSVKANVFKVAGAKSLKKTKAKAVNLGLKNAKNIKQKVADIDKQLVEIKKNPNSGPSAAKPVAKPASKKSKQKVSKEDVAKAADEIVKMDL